MGRACFAVVSSFFALTPVAVCVIAGLQLSGGHGIRSGTLVAITTMQTRLFMPLGQLLQTLTEISSSLALFTRVFACLDLDLEAEIVKPSNPVVLDEVRGEDRLSDVWQPGQLAAVVSASGAARPPPAIWSPACRTSPRAVTQETYLFQATGRDNLAYARPDAMLEDVQSAAKAAQIHDRTWSSRTATTRSSASGGIACPGARSSGWRSPGCS